MSNSLYEIMVPTQWNDGTPIKTRHHRAWDARVRKITGGLTIYQPAKGQWMHEGELFAERMIPVRVLTDRKGIKEVVKITMLHYEQLAVLCYIVSSDATVFETPQPLIDKFSREKQKGRA